MNAISSVSMRAIPHPDRRSSSPASWRSADAQFCAISRAVNFVRARPPSNIRCREHLRQKGISHVEELDDADLRVVPRFSRNFTSPSAGFAGHRVYRRTAM